jgi:uncharacterized membrane protein YedE/YeeE
MNIIEFISQPWHWSVSGLMIVLVMFLLLYFGGQFGVSSNLRTICAISGAGKNVSFFNFNWKDQVWNLVFLIGAIIGGFIAYNFLRSPEAVQISDSTLAFLSEIGVSAPQDNPDGVGYLPADIFNFDFLFSLKGMIILVFGGFLVGFGARWAGGCTSGHAISGLSNLQLPSLIAVVGFFIGGLAMTHFLLPIILK